MKTKTHKRIIRKNTRKNKTCCLRKGGSHKSDYDGYIDGEYDGYIDGEYDGYIDGEYDKQQVHSDEKTKQYEDGTYQGELNKTGQRHGNGIMEYKNGDIYKGDWSNDKKHGFGEMIFSDGYNYKGEFQHDQLHGLGEMTDIEGTYNGQWRNNEKHGKGKMTYQNGDIYEGDWQNDVKHGKGKMTYSTAGIYEGDWRDDDKHGKGKITYTNGDVYEGTIKQGLLSGKGKYVFKNGAVYKGHFVNDTFQGEGIYRFSNGDVYEGNFENDQFQGVGKITYKTPITDRLLNFDGIASYDGEWFKNLKQGKGTYTFTDGTQYTGIWENNEALLNSVQAIHLDPHKKTIDINHPLFRRALNKFTDVKNALFKRRHHYTDLNNDNVPINIPNAIIIPRRSGEQNYMTPSPSRITLEEDNSHNVRLSPSDIHPVAIARHVQSNATKPNRVKNTPV